MIKFKKTKKIFIIFITLFFVFAQAVNFPLTTYSQQSSAELLEQIKQKEKELEETKQAIKDLESQLEQNKADLENASEGLPKLEAEIAEIETQLQINQKQLELTKQQFELQKKERDRLISEQKDSVETLYLKWRAENSSFNFLSDRTEYLRAEGLSDKVFGVGNENLVDLNSSIDRLDTDIKSQDEIIALLNSQNDELNLRKQIIQEQIWFYSGVLASNTTQISALQDLQGQITSQINDLTVEQQAAAQREAWILQQELNKQRKEEDINITDGFYFAGTGRDVYQGHGVGFSQFGAYGGANAGMNYEELIKFYFTGVDLTQRTGNVNVAGGPQNINVEEYLVHLGEVPDKACGTEEQVEEKPEKYALAGDTVWNCWPEEAIKAQIVIARTYALFHVNLFADARSQVYDTSHNKKWAQEETEGIVITHGGNLIDAVYSSDNSQGYGTANNDTIFQNFYGEGTPYPYLRAVDDSNFAYKTQWTKWAYSTNVYNNETVWNMLDHLSTSSDYDQSTKDRIREVMNNIKDIESISFERDPSNRIKKVFLTGSNGNVSVIGGWWFKNLWNTWAYDTGRNDYLFSQTFFIVPTE